jgi:hypothetical protein
MIFKSFPFENLSNAWLYCLKAFSFGRERPRKQVAARALSISDVPHADDDEMSVLC